MRNAMLTAAAIALTFTVGSILADESDKKTTITLNESVLVPGKQLPAGKYVMKLADSQSNRNIVLIYNEDETELQTMFIAIPNRMVEREDETVITFWETPAGVPPAIRAWFWPGDTWGQEFAYPEELAQQIAAANNNAEVPRHEGLTEDDLEIAAGESEQAESETALQTQPQAPESATEARSPAQTDPIGPDDADALDEPADADVLAQNAPAPQAAPEQREPLPSLNEDPAQEGLGEVDALPRTASPGPWILLTGILACAGAFMLRRVKA